MSRSYVEFDSVDTNAGRADSDEWDFSYTDEGRIRVTLDEMFVVEFVLPSDYLISTFMVVDLKVIYNDVEPEPCCYEKLYLDSNDCDFIRRSIVENEVMLNKCICITPEDRVFLWNLCETVCNGVKNSQEYVTEDEFGWMQYRFDESGHFYGTTKEDLLHRFDNILKYVEE